MNKTIDRLADRVAPTLGQVGDSLAAADAALIARLSR